MFYRDENNQWQEIILPPSGDTLPIGVITQFSGENAPTNWLICDGSAVSRTTYSELFDVIGTTYGNGDGSTTFNLPNFKGKVGVGLDSSDTSFDTLGETGGEKTHTLTTQEMPSHYHYIHGYHGVNHPNYSITTEEGAAELAASYNSGGDNQHITNSVGGGQAHNNLQPYIVTNYIIKAKQSIGVVGTVNDSYSNSSTDVYSSNYINNKMYGLGTYSTTEEVLTGKYWKNGKPIYRKVFDFTTSSSTNLFPTNIQSSAVDAIWIAEPSFCVENGNYVYPLLGGSYDTLGDWIFIRLKKTSTYELEVNADNYERIGSITVTIEYTKTTD